MNLKLECDEVAHFSDEEEYDDEDDDDENDMSPLSKRMRLSQKQAKIQQSLSRSARQSSRRRTASRRAVEVDHDDTERRMVENEQFIIDLLNRTQPHHDHCYTTIFGKKRGIDDIVFTSASDDEEEDEDDVGDYIRAYGKKIIHPDKGVEPILCLGNVSVMDELTGTGTDEASKTIIVCAEEIIDDLLPEDYEGHNGQRKLVY